MKIEILNGLFLNRAERTEKWSEDIIMNLKKY